MEVYVDDILVKLVKSEDHTMDLAECFAILRKYDMKLNPKKRSFRVSSGKFLGFIVNARGIEANLEKIKALLEMPSPTKQREVQALIGRMVALNRFISKSIDKWLPFFNVL
uniref:Reverse transcriptase domain-containing protein n=1 Tax=Cannabis sativa TaxID=3483 RepID=A0A803PK51_CANSA